MVALWWLSDAQVQRLRDSGIPITVYVSSNDELMPPKHQHHLADALAAKKVVFEVGGCWVVLSFLPGRNRPVFKCKRGFIVRFSSSSSLPHSTINKNLLQQLTLQDHAHIKVTMHVASFQGGHMGELGEGETYPKTFIAVLEHMNRFKC